VEIENKKEELVLGLDKEENEMNEKLKISSLRILCLFPPGAGFSVCRNCIMKIKIQNKHTKTSSAAGENQKTRRMIQFSPALRSYFLL
jgi:hypothetical protein